VLEYLREKGRKFSLFHPPLAQGAFSARTRIEALRVHGRKESAAPIEARDLPGRVATVQGLRKQRCSGRHLQTAATGAWPCSLQFAGSQMGGQWCAANVAQWAVLVIGIQQKPPMQQASD